MFSKVLRRTHMYLALFLTPWVLMYTLSTMAMNHRDFFRKMYAGQPRVEIERETTYSGTFPADATAQVIAPQILQTLHLDGSHYTRKEKDGSVMIERSDPLSPRIIRYYPDTGRLTIEKQIFHAPRFLEEMHRRRGFQRGYVVNNTWSLSVDLFICGMIFWALSGLWLWWELRITRRLGALCMAIGFALFLFYTFSI